METSGSVNNDHIRIVGNCALERIESHRSRICTKFLLDDRDIGASAPFLKLLDCSGAECICCAKDYFVSCLLKLCGHLSDCGSLSDTVYTDNHNHMRLM